MSHLRKLQRKSRSASDISHWLFPRWLTFVTLAIFFLGDINLAEAAKPPTRPPKPPAPPPPTVRARANPPRTVPPRVNKTAQPAQRTVARRTAATARPARAAARPSRVVNTRSSARPQLRRTNLPAQRTAGRPQTGRNPQAANRATRGSPRQTARARVNQIKQSKVAQASRIRNSGMRNAPQRTRTVTSRTSGRPQQIRSAKISQARQARQFPSARTQSRPTGANSKATRRLQQIRTTKSAQTALARRSGALRSSQSTTVRPGNRPSSRAYRRATTASYVKAARAKNRGLPPSKGTTTGGSGSPKAPGPPKGPAPPKGPGPPGKNTSKYVAIAQAKMAERARINDTGRYLMENWHKSTSDSRTDSIRYHLDEHGKGRSATEYTAAAMRFFEKNKHLAKECILRDGSPGLQIKTKYKDANGKTRKARGYWSIDGKLVTFAD
jgi:hypothetical protein